MPRCRILGDDAKSALKTVCPQQVKYADGESDSLLLASERLRLLMVAGEPLPPPSVAQLQTLADVFRARAYRLDGANGTAKAASAVSADADMEGVHCDPLMARKGHCAGLGHQALRPWLHVIQRTPFCPCAMQALHCLAKCLCDVPGSHRITPQSCDLTAVGSAQMDPARSSSATGRNRCVLRPRRGLCTRCGCSRISRTPRRQPPQPSGLRRRRRRSLRAQWCGRVSRAGRHGRRS